jgi:hypothetical protein
LRSLSPFLRLKGIEIFITLSAISIMMLRVLVLLGAKARGLCCDVIMLRESLDWFLPGFIGFSVLVWVFVGFFHVSLPFLFLYPFEYFLYAQGRLRLL